MTVKSDVAVVFERALKDIFARVCHLQGVSPKALAVAYSGGLDSSVLLHLASAYAKQGGFQLFAFHVHHGISPNADAWLRHCEEGAHALGIAFDAQRVQLQNLSESGVEEAARLGRYAALGQLCRKHQVSLLLTAHHQDDQAETVLLQLLRGSGVPGLCGMEELNAAPELLGDEALLMARPLLETERAELALYAAKHTIRYVDDESNDDARYARNALRHHIMAPLQNNFPGFQKRVARASQHMQSAQRLLDTLAEQDLAGVQEGECLKIDGLMRLDADRLDNLLRFWLSRHGMRMPSTAWLTELRKQLLEAKEDAQLCLAHPDGQIRRYRGGVYFTRNFEMNLSEIAPHRFSWQGEAQLAFPEFGGILHFDHTEFGVSADWLKGQLLEVRGRTGGERLKPAPNRSTRSLKHHYQALGIPLWQRDRLPLVFADMELLYAAGIGMDCNHFTEASETKISLRWESLSAN